MITCQALQKTVEASASIESEWRQLGAVFGINIWGGDIVRIMRPGPAYLSIRILMAGNFQGGEWLPLIASKT